MSSRGCVGVFSAMRKSTLSEMRRLAKRRGGRCLSGAYVNSRTSLYWRCRLGHVWKAMPTNLTKGSWCPECAHRKRLTLEEMQTLAARRGGECLSDRYLNNGTKLSWRCANGHQWEAAPGLVKGGRWCPYCAHVAQLSLGSVAAIAAPRGGRCLSTEYRNAETALWWRCKEGHEWSATAASVQAGRWCALCAHNHRLGLRALQRLAEERGGRCLSSRYRNNRQQLIWECRRGHIWRAAAANVKGGASKKGTWCPECYNLRRRFRQRDSIEIMQELARSRGGLCLSEEYTNSKSKLLWQCERGHQWHAVPFAIRRGSWCPVCAGNQKLTLAEFYSLAACRGGKCLSDRYLNKETALRWECALGHRWSARPGKVKRGAWCARCSNEKRRSPWKKPLVDRETREVILASSPGRKTVNASCPLPIESVRQE
jgi:hypothetical protein